MATAINPNHTWEYVIEADRREAPEKQTRFKLRALTPSQLAEVTDMGFEFQLEKETKERTYRATPATQVLTTLRHGLVGWSNFKDASGKAVEVPDAAEGRVALLSEDDRIEIAREIRFGGQVTVEEGNS